MDAGQQHQRPQHRGAGRSRQCLNLNYLSSSSSLTFRSLANRAPPVNRYTRPMVGKLKSWARTIKRDVHAIYFAARDPRTPWYAKALALCVAG